MKITKIPKRFQPRGFHIIYEDDDIIVGEKSPGILTVGALWDRVHTVHYVLNQYVRKGNPRSRKCVFVVHRLDQATSGLLIFAKSEPVQIKLKDNWRDIIKTYYCVVHGTLRQKVGTISSYLVEDENYTVRSTDDSSAGRLSHTEYAVIKETSRFSLLKINLLTGRKNQIRVHLSGEGHPVVGDAKYGDTNTRYQRLALHSQSIIFSHPVTGERLTFESPIPEYFHTLVGDWSL